MYFKVKNTCVTTVGRVTQTSFNEYRFARFLLVDLGLVRSHWFIQYRKMFSNADDISNMDLRWIKIIFVIYMLSKTP